MSVLIVGFALSVFLGFGCSESNPGGARFVLSVATKGEGRVTRDPNAHLYRAGTVVTLTAVAGSNSIFERWRGAVGNMTDTTAPTLRVVMDRGRDITADFIVRPDRENLDLVSDLRHYLADAGESVDVERFDKNGVSFDAQGTCLNVPNGIPDAAELLLLEAVLKDTTLDLSNRSGVVHKAVWMSFARNLDMLKQHLGGKNERVQRVVAAYATLGDYGSVDVAFDILYSALNADTKFMWFDHSPWTYLTLFQDADTDGRSNYEEWLYVAEDVASDSLSRYATAALDGNAPPGEQPQRPLEEIAPLDVRAHMARWRKHILDIIFLGDGPAMSSMDYEALVQGGPSILPEVFAIYRAENDPDVLRCMRWLILGIGHFTPFHYTTVSKLLGTRQMEYHGKLPLLSEDITDGYSGGPAHAVEKQNPLVQWWEQRDTFLSEDRIEKIRAATGRTAEDFAAFDQEGAREFDTLLVYGIYNIPALIEVVSEDNNPVAFVEFLRSSGHELYSGLTMTNDTVVNARTASEACPTRDEKVKLIRNWWIREGHRFVGLLALHEAIDRAVAAASSES